MAPKALSDTTVGALTAQLFAARPSLAKTIPSAAKIEKPDTDKDAAVPAHPGAAAFIDGTERTFMERYSDYIWGAVLLLSVLGSATAWLRHYIKRDERKLNTLQREADEILRETLECYDDGAIEQGDLMAYGLVLDQFHNAIVDRRAAIGGTANLPRMRA